jgi:hypothetical protein
MKKKNSITSYAPYSFYDSRKDLMELAKPLVKKKKRDTEEGGERSRKVIKNPK